MISTTQLLAIMPLAGSRVPMYVQPLNDALDEFGITTPARTAAFLAQIAHESAELRFTLELADGTAYEPPTQNAADLGNTEPGDGPRFKGRGLLQVTGRRNYRDCGAGLGLDLVAHPELLEAPTGACRSAAWFWRGHGLNEAADVDRFFAITKTINGGYTHGDERLAYWLRARRALGIA
jgi:putative chitinase